MIQQGKIFCVKLENSNLQVGINSCRNIIKDNYWL